MMPAGRQWSSSQHCGLGAVAARQPVIFSLFPGQIAVDWPAVGIVIRQRGVNLSQLESRVLDDDLLGSIPIWWQAAMRLTVTPAPATRGRPPRTPGVRTMNLPMSAWANLPFIHSQAKGAPPHCQSGEHDHGTTGRQDEEGVSPHY